MGKRLTTKEFIARARAIHGRRYDYTRVKYVKSTEKVNIICRKHGRFPQIPKDHWRGEGCMKCGRISAKEKLSDSVKAFISKGRKKHGGRFDYSKVKYRGWDQPVTIICAVHGRFSVKPNKHLFTLNGGCGDCARRPKKDTKRFIKDARKVHGKRYDYSQVQYINDSTHVTIICRKHGPFPQSPSDHLQGKRCAECAGRPKKDTERFIKEARKVHGNDYEYAKTKYINNRTDVTIICPIHGPFPQTPGHHLGGQGCIDCTDFGFKPGKPGLLYYLRIDVPVRRRPLYKIGVTNQNMEIRLKTIRAKDGTDITVLYKRRYKTGEGARRRERKIIQENMGYRYRGKRVVGSGFTEVFTRDILELDNC